MAQLTQDYIDSLAGSVASDEDVEPGKDEELAGSVASDEDVEPGKDEDGEPMKKRKKKNSESSGNS